MPCRPWVRGGGAFRPISQTTTPSEVAVMGARDGPTGGGGVQGIPTYVPQSDRDHMQIILRHISWGEFFSKKNFVQPALRPGF